jgi:hypothetical protein
MYYLAQIFAGEEEFASLDDFFKAVSNPLS